LEFARTQFFLFNYYQQDSVYNYSHDGSSYCLATLPENFIQLEMESTQRQSIYDELQNKFEYFIHPDLRIYLESVMPGSDEVWIVGAEPRKPKVPTINVFSLKLAVLDESSIKDMQKIPFQDSDLKLGLSTQEIKCNFNIVVNRIATKKIQLMYQDAGKITEIGFCNILSMMEGITQRTNLTAALDIKLIQRKYMNNY
jgi:hypothetical protein